MEFGMFAQPVIPRSWPRMHRPAVAHGGDLPAGAWRPESVGELLPRAARSSSAGLTHCDGDRLIVTSYRTLQGDAERLIGALSARGVAPRTPLILQTADSRLLLTALWAGLLADMPPVLLPPAGSTGQPELARARLVEMWKVLGRPAVLAGHADTVQLGALLEDASGTRPEIHAVDALVAEPHALPQAAAPGCGDQTALMIVTSGSTDAPKLIELSHRNVVASVAASAFVNGYRSDDISLNWLPLYHVGALMRSIREVYVGCPQVQVATSYVREDPLRWLDLIGEHRATMTWATNTSFAAVVARGDQISNRRAPALHRLRSLHSSGEPVLAATMRAFLELLEQYGLSSNALHTAWGMTDACFATCSHTYFDRLRADGAPIAESGAPVPGMALRIVDDSGRLLREGEVGHLQIRGDIVGRAHASFRDDESANTADGWARTGDLATVSDGRLTIAGRFKDIIKVGGSAHSAEEVQAIVAQCDEADPTAVAACAVPGAAGEGEVLAIFVRPRRPIDDCFDDLVHAVRCRVSSACGIVPQFVVPVDGADLPRTGVGKLQRRRLSAEFAAGRFDRWRRWPCDLRAVPPVADRHGEQLEPALVLAARIAAVFQRLLGVPIRADHNVFASGGSSLQVAMAAAELGEIMPGRVCGIADVFHAPTPLALAERLLAPARSRGVEAGDAAARARVARRGAAGALAGLRRTATRERR